MTIPSLAKTFRRAFSLLRRNEPQMSSIPGRADDMPVPQGFASASVRAEGWNVVDCGLIRFRCSTKDLLS